MGDGVLNDSLFVKVIGHTFPIDSFGPRPVPIQAGVSATLTTTILHKSHRNLQTREIKCSENRCDLLFIMSKQAFFCKPLSSERPREYESLRYMFGEKVFSIFKGIPLTPCNSVALAENIDIILWHYLSELSFSTTEIVKMIKRYRFESICTFTFFCCSGKWNLSLTTIKWAELHVRTNL